MVKNCHFNNLESFEYWFFEIHAKKFQKISKTSKFKGAKMVKMAILGAFIDQNWFHVKSD